MAVRRGEQPHQEGRLLHSQGAGRLAEQAAGGILEAPARPKEHTIEVAQQQIGLAEARLQLHGHQQFPPFPAQGLALTHHSRVKAAGQLLGERAAPLQHPTAQQVGYQGATGADRVDPGVPPETLVLTGQQGIDEHLRIATQPRLFPVAPVIGRSDRPVGPVVEQQRPPDRGQASPDGNQQGPQQPEQQATSGQGGRSQNRESELAEPVARPRVVECNFRQFRQLRWPQAHPIPIAEQQFTHPAPLPPQPIGGARVAEQPVLPPPFQQGMATAHRRLLKHNLGVGVPADPIEAAVQWNPPLQLGLQVDGEAGAGTLSHDCPRGRRPGRRPCFAGIDCCPGRIVAKGGLPAGRGRSRPPPG